MKRMDLLREARSAPAKEGLEAHRQAIQVLRDKGYTWREIANFLNERGIATDHTAVYRLIKGRGTMAQELKVPPAADYMRALSEIRITDKQRQMLVAHFHHHNRSITFGELAKAAGYDDISSANLQYGLLGSALGEKLNFSFWRYPKEEGEWQFRSSSIGCGNQYVEGPFQLVMHHELAKAIEQLGWA